MIHHNQSGKIQRQGFYCHHFFFIAMIRDLLGFGKNQKHIADFHCYTSRTAMLTPGRKELVLLQNILETYKGAPVIPCLFSQWQNLSGEEHMG